MRIGFLGMLGLIFIGMKLAGVIAWPWLWVLAPFWLPTAFFICSLILGPLLAVGTIALAPFWLLPALILFVCALCVAPIMALVLLPLWLPVALLVIGVAAVAMFISKALWPNKMQERYAHVHRSEFRQDPRGNDDIDVDSEKL